MKLDDRFGSLDRTKVPDVWEDARQRAPRDLSGFSGTRRVATIVLALLIGIIGAGAGIFAFDRGSIPAATYPMSAWSNGLIAVREVGANMTAEILTIDPATGRSTVFSELPAQLALSRSRLDMAWSPDGTTLAVGGRAPLGSISESGSPGIWLLRRGAAPQQVESGSWESPSWSPDGSHIAFAGGGGAAGIGIYTMDADGTHIKQQASFPALGVSYPQWSPDGTKFTFSGEASGGGAWAVYVVNVDGSGLRKVADGSWSRWAPDSRSLVFMTDTGELQIVGADGSNVRTVLDCRRALPSCQGALAPQFSPDGRSILFWFDPGRCDSSNRCSYVTIPTDTGFRLLQHIPWTVGIDGSNPTPLKGFHVTDGILGSAWQPVSGQTNQGSASPSPKVRPIRAATVEPAGRIQLSGFFITSAVEGFGSMWVGGNTNHGSQEILRLNPSNGAVEQRFPVHAIANMEWGGEGVILGDHTILAAGTDATGKVGVMSIAPISNTMTTFEIPAQGVRSVAYQEGSIWASAILDDSGHSELVRMDATTGAIIQTTPFDAAWTDGVFPSGENAWVFEHEVSKTQGVHGGSLVRVSPGPSVIVGTGGSFATPVTDGTAIYTPYYGDATSMNLAHGIAEVDPSTGALLATWKTNTVGYDLAIGSDGALWFLSGTNLERLNPKTGQTDVHFDVGGNPVFVTTSGTNVWVGQYDGYLQHFIIKS